MNVFRVAVSASSFSHTRIMPTTSKAKNFTGNALVNKIEKIIDRTTGSSQAFPNNIK